jgi:hypothetical protein
LLAKEISRLKNRKGNPTVMLQQLAKSRGKPALSRP